MRLRTKSKSVCDAEGNPTSISLNPMRTSRSNMMRLRSGLIGSMRAWLPSRRSTAHQRGACVMVFVGHVRSGRSTGSTDWYGAYLWMGSPEGCWRFCMRCSWRFAGLGFQPTTNSATREAKG